MPLEAIEALKQWGPYCLMGFGVLVMFLSTILYRQHIGILKRIVDSAWFRQGMQKMPEFERKTLMRVRESLESPMWQWLGIIQAVAMIARGLVWMYHL